MNNTNDSAITTSDKIPLFNERYEFKAEALSMLHGMIP